MAPTAATETIAMLADVLRGRSSVALTGAGISTDSGIPDYRGSGVDRRRRPSITYREFMRDPAARRRYWARSHIGLPHVMCAQPNDGHRAVAALEAAGLLTAVITQNVDGLHDRAGSTRVLELHGRLDRVVCTSCGDRTPRGDLTRRLSALNPAVEAAAIELAPDGDAEIPEELLTGFRVAPCLRCGGVLKPDVTFFGESMPTVRRTRAADMVAEADTLLVLGSSLAVMSGYRLVLQAVREDMPVAIVTRGPSRGDAHATVRLDMGLSDALPALVAVLAGVEQPA